MGWAWLASLAFAAAVTTSRTGVPRALMSVVLAALLLGATGYAWQGRPTLAGHPVIADTAPVEVDPGMVAFREAVMPGEAGDARTLAAADDDLRRGDTGAAVERLLQAVAARPRDAALWTGLGGAFAAHDGGQVSPAARFALRQAVRLAPEAVGPPFFLGMAYAQAGELKAAKLAWLRALTLSPRDAPWRIDIAERLALIDEFQAMNPPPR